MPQVDINFEVLGESAASIQARPKAGANVVTPDLQLQRKIWRISQILKQEFDCQDIVPGMNNLTVFFDPTLDSSELWLDRLERLWNTTEAESFQQREIDIPTYYGGEHGPDLQLVAEHCELSIEEVVSLHSQTPYTVYFLGFQPGFAYMGGLPQRLNTPRRADPRILVPGGSVGIGGSQTGIYPSQSPGGWQLIAWTPLCLFNPANEPASLLGPGDIVRFRIEGIDA
ncbi:5-oxoprolinase subunit PxpB [Undibacterium sp. LX40W]|uniref:5-oxoprolinase subunit PxpB n=1 Tax=Undibacterium nitidum TaxID=2762298 RepID=A0A923KTP5_9BURK|nr:MULTISPECIES: 5-oxoprolinase subunit PxpB [Undibacterium]MBC3881447.1 5-oxoprolinase subunit PxpB [Undibacterium nitidum]MBC3891770.1 5-oxoprolinase subunit PxpB [Undibacterium sp. LX40W]